MISILEEVEENVGIASKAKSAKLSTGGLTVDPSCNTSITVTCLQQLYNAVGYVASNTTKNSVGITGYLVSKLVAIGGLQHSFNFLSGTICEY